MMWPIKVKKHEAEPHCGSAPVLLDSLEKITWKLVNCQEMASCTHRLYFMSDSIPCINLFVDEIF